MLEKNVCKEQAITCLPINFNVILIVKYAKIKRNLVALKTKKIDKNYLGLYTQKRVAGSIDLANLVRQLHK